MKLRNYCSLVLLLCLVSVGAVGQNKSFVKSIDSTSTVVSNRYIVENNFSWLKDDLEPFNLDQEALNATVFKSVNESRNKARKNPCNYDEKLDIIAYHYVLKLKSHKFKNTGPNHTKINRYMYWISRKIGITDGFVVAVVNVPYLIDYKPGSDFYYNQKEDETDLHLFYGRKSQLRDSTYIPRPIPKLSYQEFGDKVARQLMRGKSGRKLRANVYTKMACWIMPIEKSLAGKRIPQAKMIIVFSGMRMQEIALRQPQ